MTRKQAVHHTKMFVASWIVKSTIAKLSDVADRMPDTAAIINVTIIPHLEDLMTVVKYHPSWSIKTFVKSTEKKKCQPKKAKSSLLSQTK